MKYNIAQIMSYRYVPSDDASNEIRLIRILPGDGDTTLCETNVCRLESSTAPAHDAKPQRWQKQSSRSYYALSYEWGSQDEPETIKLDGQDFRVGQNLFKFLRQISINRRVDISEGDFYIWIDAISIDQSNLTEKASQVQNMTSIFASTKEVLMWLGEYPKNDIDPCINLEKIGKFLCSLLEFMKAIAADFEIPKDAFKAGAASHMLALDLNFWDWSASAGVSKMLELNYWNRRWIMQEVYVARSLTLLCNQYELDIGVLHEFHRHQIRGPNLYGQWMNLGVIDIERAWIEISEGGGVPDSTVEHVRSISEDIWMLWWSFDNGFFGRLSTYRVGEPSLSVASGSPSKEDWSPITQLLKSFGGSQCLLLQDRIFALRAFIDDPACVTVDYECSSWDIVYQILASQSKISSEDVLQLIDELEIVEDTPGSARDALLRIPLSAEQQSLVTAESPNWKVWDVCATKINESKRDAYPGDLDHPPLVFPGQDKSEDDRPRMLRTVREYELESFVEILLSVSMRLQGRTRANLEQSICAITSHLHSTSDLPYQTRKEPLGRAYYALDQENCLYVTSIRTSPGDMALSIGGGSNGIILRQARRANELAWSMVGSFRKNYLPPLDELVWSKEEFKCYCKRGFFADMSATTLSEAEKIIDYYISSLKIGASAERSSYTEVDVSAFPAHDLRAPKTNLKASNIQDMKLEISVRDLALYYRWHEYCAQRRWKKDLSV